MQAGGPPLGGPKGASISAPGACRARWTTGCRFSALNRRRRAASGPAPVHT